MSLRGGRSSLRAYARSRPLASLATAMAAPHAHLLHALDELVDISEPLPKQLLLLLDRPLHAFLARHAARIAEGWSDWCGGGRGGSRGGTRDGRRTGAGEIDTLP